MVTPRCYPTTFSLSERLFTCENCNFQIDRDLNASINLPDAVS
ncbi:MAG: zinc ribbon domain-containing protein [Cyanobacteria bacterium P01_D01_bin.50]